MRGSRNGGRSLSNFKSPSCLHRAITYFGVQDEFDRLKKLSRQEQQQQQQQQPKACVICLEGPCERGFVVGVAMLNPMNDMCIKRLP